MRHELEQSILDDYKKKQEVYVNICYLLHQADMTESDKDLYELSLKKASGCKMMIDHMEKNTVLPVR